MTDTFTPDATDGWGEPDPGAGWGCPEYGAGFGADPTAGWHSPAPDLTAMQQPDLSGITNMEQLMHEADTYNSALLGQQMQLIHHAEQAIGPAGGAGILNDSAFAVPTSGLQGMAALRHEAETYNTDLAAADAAMFRAHHPMTENHNG